MTERPSVLWQQEGLVWRPFLFRALLRALSGRPLVILAAER